MSEIEQPEVVKQPEPIWAIVANVREEMPVGPGMQEMRRGTKKFNAGAKIYFIGVDWTDFEWRIGVVGHYRGKKGYITDVLFPWYVTNWRVELIYSPHLTRLLARGQHIGGNWRKWEADSSSESKAKAEQLAKVLSDYSDEYHAKRLARRAAFKEEQEKDQSEGLEN